MSKNQRNHLIFSGKKKKKKLLIHQTKLSLKFDPKDTIANCNEFAIQRRRD